MIPCACWQLILHSDCLTFNTRGLTVTLALGYSERLNAALEKEKVKLPFG